MDQALINHRAQILKQLLPALSQTVETLEHALSQMAAAVLQNTNNNRLARDEKLAREQTPKLPSDKYTFTLNILLEYLEIADEQQLPKLWHNWSNCTKKQEFQVLTELLQAYTCSPEAFTSTPPVVTAKLIQDLQNFLFVSESMDDLKSGLQPFIIVEGSAEYRKANLEVSRLYGLLISGEHYLVPFWATNMF
jgi:hypothetical protein